MHHFSTRLLGQGTAALLACLPGWGCQIEPLGAIETGRPDPRESVHLVLRTVEATARSETRAELSGYRGATAIMWGAADGAFVLSGERLSPGNGFLSQTQLAGVMPREVEGQSRHLTYSGIGEPSHSAPLPPGPPVHFDWIFERSQTNGVRYAAGYSPSGGDRTKVTLSVEDPTHRPRSVSCSGRQADIGHATTFWSPTGEAATPAFSLDPVPPHHIRLVLSREIVHEAEDGLGPFASLEVRAARESAVRLPAMETGALDLGVVATPDHLSALRHPQLPLVATTERLADKVIPDEDDTWLQIHEGPSSLRVPGLIPLAWHPTSPVLLAMDHGPPCDSSARLKFVRIPRSLRTWEVGQPDPLVARDAGASAAITLEIDLAAEVRWSVDGTTVTVGDTPIRISRELLSNPDGLDPN